MQAQDLDGKDINADVEIPPATRVSQKAPVPKTNEFDDDDDAEVEDLPTRITGMEADRPQSSGSAGSGSASRATAKIRADPSLPRGVVRIGNEDAPAPPKPDVPEGESADGAQEEGEATASQRRRTADASTGEHETDGLVAL